MSPVRPYRGWIRGADDRSDLADDLSAGLADLDAAERAGQAIMADGSISLRPWMPPIYDQGNLQSCTAHALGASIAFEHPGLQPSRLQIYYRSRSYEHRTHVDGGARLHNGIRALREHGVAQESEWPYDEAKVFVRPGLLAVEVARAHRITRYAPLAGGEQFQACLKHGYPFVIGMHLTDSFWSEDSRQTGVIRAPQPGEPTPHSHAVCVIGYTRHCALARQHLGPDMPERDQPYYEARNSVGADWGDEGHFWVPASYLENPVLAGDAWTIRR